MARPSDDCGGYKPAPMSKAQFDKIYGKGKKSAAAKKKSTPKTGSTKKK